MPTLREEWLALTNEEPLDHDLPICDSHLHLWYLPDPFYEARKRAGKEMRPTDCYTVDDFLQDNSGGHNITRTVFAECGSMYRESGPQEMQPVGETEFIASLSGQYGSTEITAGIVGFADLTLGAAVAPVLEAHISAGKGRFRGIRARDLHQFGSPENILTLLSDAKFLEGFACLEKYGLSFDFWPTHTQLIEIVELAKNFPHTTVILNHIGDHIGDPLVIGSDAGKREEAFQQWKREIAAVATCPNVVIKLGGLGMPLYGFGWHERATPLSSAELAEVMAPYCLWCIEQFGADRCMFESNFPGDKVSYSYIVVWNAFKRIVKNFPPSAQSALFHDTAVRVYHLANQD